MARSNTGSVVSRAAATGGVRRRSGSTGGPSRFQLLLAAIVVLGLLSVAWAKVDYNNAKPKTSTDKTAPAVGTTWFSGLLVSVCGTDQPPLAASPSTATGLTTLGGGVIKIAPTTTNNSGKNANLARFFSEYEATKGATSIVVSKTQLILGPVSYKSGDKCPSNTPYAGKKAIVSIGFWRNYAEYKAATSPKVYLDPTNVLFKQNSFITVAYQPVTTPIPKPSEAVANSVLSGGSVPAPTTTTTVKK